VCGIGCPRSMRRGTPYALVGPPAKCPLWTAAVMFPFTAGGLARVRFDLGGSAVSTDRQTDMVEMIGDFCGLQIFYVNAPALFRCAYISICVLFDVRTYRFPYFSMCVHLDLRTFLCA
jgi:hypothetical protein